MGIIHLSDLSQHCRLVTTGLIKQTFFYQAFRHFTLLLCPQTLQIIFKTYGGYSETNQSEYFQHIDANITFLDSLCFEADQSRYFQHMDANNTFF
jgi:hypothetical protein